MTETATVATSQTVEDHRLGSVGKAAAGLRGQDRRRRRGPDQGPEHLRRLLQERRRQLRHDRRRLAAHRRPRLARRGRLPLHHRPQEGHHHHRGRQEPHAGQHRERPQAVALDLAGRDVRRPPALPGGADHARPRGDRPLRQGARAVGGPGGAGGGPQGPRADPGHPRRGEQEVRAGRAGQEVRDPRPRPVAGDRRADADAEGQAQRGQREVRRPVRAAVREASRRRTAGAASRWSARGCGARRGSSPSRPRSA